MACRTNSKYKICRRLGVNLWGDDKDPYLKKSYFPGQHGPSMNTRRNSDYAIQLIAKQKLKFYYANIGEKQFKTIYKEAIRLKGDASENLIRLLESRVDAILYRSNFVPSPHSARQIINHQHIKLNDKKMTIPSVRLKVGSVLTLSNKMLNSILCSGSIQKKQNPLPAYLEINEDQGTITLIKEPTFAEVPYPCVMEPNLVIEYYSNE